MWVFITDCSSDSLCEESLCGLLDVNPIKMLHMVFSNEGLAKADAKLKCEVVGSKVVGVDVVVELRRGL